MDGGKKGAEPAEQPVPHVHNFQDNGYDSKTKIIKMPKLGTA